NRPVRIAAYNLQTFFLLLQKSAYSGDGPAGSHAANKNVYLSPGLTPNLRPRCPVMSIGISPVLILVRHVGARSLFRQSLRDLGVMFSGFRRNVCWGHYDLCSVCSKDALFF